MLLRLWSFRLALLSFALFALGRILAGYRGHFVLQWLGAVTLVLAVVLLILKK